MKKIIVITKRLLSISLVLILLLGVAGCMFRKSKAEAAIEYMENKYDDTFTFTHYMAGDPKSYVILKSEKFPDANVQVNGYSLKDGEYEFWDNYVYCKYEDETRDFLENFFECVFECEVKINYDIGYGYISKDDLTDNTTFDEFIHSTTYGIVFTVLVSDKCQFKKMKLKVV